MDKNSIIGFVLIAFIIGGFTFYQSRQYKKQVEVQQQIDSVARAEARAQFVEDSIKAAALDSLVLAGDSAAIAETTPEAIVYKDSLLSSAAQGEAETVALSNNKVDIVLTTKGAQPYSVKVKDYLTWDGNDLELIKAGHSKYRVSIYAGEYISTDDFNFQVAQKTDSSVVMVLPFSNGGYIQQSYTLPADSYELVSELAFVGMDGVIPANVSSIDIDWGVVIPRLEKGYKNEKQYSSLCYYLTGEKAPEQLGRARDGAKSVPTKVKWFAFHQQFFSAILTADNEFSSGDFALKFFAEEDEDANLMNCTAKMRAEIGHGADAKFSSRYYFGPNHFATLKALDNKYEKIIPLGGNIIGWISRIIIIPTFNFLSRFMHSYGLIILIMTILLKLVISPLTAKSFMSSAKMQAIKPEIDELNKKYPKQEDAMKKQQAQMDLYKRAGINPMGGCLPMLLQLPILWAMFRFFPASIELRQQPFLWCHDLSAYDSIINFGFRIPLLGDHLSLFALLMAITMFFYSRLTTASMGGDDPNMASMKFMNVWLMPIMMLFICNNLSAALSYYYCLSNLITIGINFVIKKWFVNPDEIRAKLAATPKGAQKKSKWMQRLEEAQKMQQAQLKNAKKK